jgi:hypothetical protein
VKNLIKYLESKGIQYTIKDQAIIIDLGYDNTWINAHGKEMKERATLRIYKLESYRQNNYGSGHNYEYSKCKRQEHKTQKDVVNYIEQIINK